MYKLPFSISILLVLFVSMAFGQQAINGLVLDSVTQKTIANASIRNVIRGNTVITNKSGVFFIEAQLGNVLAISARGYYSDTLIINGEMMAKGGLVVLLRQLPSTLPEVTVTGGLSRYQLDSAERRRAFLAEAGKITIPAVGRTNDLGFGVALNLDRFSKKEKKKREAYTLFDLTEEEAYINYRWNEELVYQFTKLDGDSLTDFMQTYRPEYSWLRKNPDEEALVYYINKQLKRYYHRIKED